MLAERFHELFDYDPETGVLTRRISKGGAKRGSRAGWINHEGYRRVQVDGRSFMETFVIWVMMTGEEPHLEVDHINRKRADNRWTNLRLATRSQQMGNAVRRRPAESGVRGVTYDRSRDEWVARLHTGGKMRYLGRFNQLEDAAAAYRQAAEKHFGKEYVQL